TLALCVFVAISALCSLSALFIFKKTRADAQKAKASPTRVINLLSAIAATACACTVLPMVVEGGAGKNDQGETLTLTSALLIVMFLLCIAYSLSKIANREGAVVIVSGIAELIFCLYIIVTLYFDPKIELNSPFKLLIQFAAAALALSTCAELRLFISEISTGAYIALKTLSITLGLVSVGSMVCLAAQEVALGGTTYLVYSVYFASRAICSAYDLICLKAKAISNPKISAQSADN
ncbi:MAG: hypothetical protein IJB94_07960, partial [Clostridia bacterium]|nr:hypothetical protein [Clostridia bacterium]